MLAPTTILTEQHYNTAVERFKDFELKSHALIVSKHQNNKRLY